MVITRQCRPKFHQVKPYKQLLNTTFTAGVAIAIAQLMNVSRRQTQTCSLTIYLGRAGLAQEEYLAETVWVSCRHTSQAV